MPYYSICPTWMVPRAPQAAHTALMRHFKLVTALFLVALIMTFTLQNYEVVQLRLLFWTMEMSRAVLVFLVFTTGIGLGWIIRSLK